MSCRRGLRIDGQRTTVRAAFNQALQMARAVTQYAGHDSLQAAAQNMTLMQEREIRQFRHWLEEWFGESRQ